MNEEEKKALRLIEDSLNKKCNGLECKVVKNNIDLRLENIRLKRQIDLMSSYICCMAYDKIIKKLKEDDIAYYGIEGSIKQYFERKVENGN